MAELRWVLLALGILVVTGVYVWSRGFLRRSRGARESHRQREEPRISLESDLLARPSAFADEAYSAPAEKGEPVEGRAAGAGVPGAREAAPRRAGTAPKAPEKIITVRFIPKNHELGGEEAVAALREVGLEHGHYDIFHKHGGTGEVLFSVASLTEPGSFDLDHLGTISGMSFFVALPSVADPVECFDAMVETARVLAHELDADLFDDRGSSWSIQRERYLREELIRYRHLYYTH